MAYQLLKYMGDKPGKKLLFYIIINGKVNNKIDWELTEIDMASSYASHYLEIVNKTYKNIKIWRGRCGMTLDTWALQEWKGVFKDLEVRFLLRRTPLTIPILQFTHEAQLFISNLKDEKYVLLHSLYSRAE